MSTWDEDFINAEVRGFIEFDAQGGGGEFQFAHTPGTEASFQKLALDLLLVKSRLSGRRACPNQALDARTPRAAVIPGEGGVLHREGGPSPLTPWRRWGSVTVKEVRDRPPCAGALPSLRKPVILSP
jgi:hypothetical protein